MSSGSVAAKGVFMRRARVMTVVGAALILAGAANVPAIRAQSPQSPAPKVRLPDEAAGLEAIVRTLVGAFDQADVVALGEWHRHRLDSDLRIALVRHPDFAKKVLSIVIECGSATEQSTLDRYIQGENVSKAELERVWKATDETTNGFCDDPMYTEFLAAVRDVNARLPAEARIRVLGGHPGPVADRGVETTAVSLLREQVLRKHGKALVIFGAAHFYRTLPMAYLSTVGDDIGIPGKLETEFPGRTFVVIPVGPLDPPRGVTGDIEPDFRKFDRALKTPVRPVLVSLQRSPFRGLSAEEFLGRAVTTCSRDRGCVSAFKGSTLTLSQIADACVYIAGVADVDKKAKPTR